MIKKMLAASAILFCCQTDMMAQQNAAKSKKGFQSLFDGKTTAGWHNFNKTTIGTGWKVEDGALYLDPSVKDGGDIVTDASYENFHFKIEWKVSKKANSGIMYFVQEGSQYRYPWNTGPEMQVIDNDEHPDAKNVKHRAGDLYDLIACSTETVKPVGEWNLAEIICNKGKLTLKLNGKVVVETRYDDDAWKQLIAGSKFKSMPGFGTFTSGKIALQDHGDAIWFRNIEIRQL